MGILDQAMQQPTSATQPAGNVPQATLPAVGAKPAPPAQATGPMRTMGLQAMKAIFSQPGSDQIVAKIKAGADNPAQAVAEAAKGVLDQIKSPQGPDVSASVAMPTICWVMELGGAAKVIEPSMDLMKGALAALAQMKKGEQAAPAQPAAPMPAQAPQAQAQPMGA